MFGLEYLEVYSAKIVALFDRFIKLNSSTTAYNIGILFYHPRKYSLTKELQLITKIKASFALIIDYNTHTIHVSLLFL